MIVYKGDKLPHAHRGKRFLIYTDDAEEKLRNRKRGDILDEVFYHEATHVSLDE